MSDRYELADEIADAAERVRAVTNELDDLPEIWLADRNRDDLRSIAQDLDVAALSLTGDRVIVVNGVET